MLRHTSELGGHSGQPQEGTNKLLKSGLVHIEGFGQSDRVVVRCAVGDIISHDRPAL